MSNEPEDLIITINDVRRCGYCPSGIRNWFHTRGLDFRAFLKDGIPISALSGLNDAMAIQVIERRRERDAKAAQQQDQTNG